MLIKKLLDERMAHNRISNRMKSRDPLQPRPKIWQKRRCVEIAKGKYTMKMKLQKERATL
jgi:hypothetical protein